MKLFTLKINNKKLFIVFLCLVAGFLILLEFLSAGAQNPTPITDNVARVNFIKSLGVSVDEELLEEKQIIIPETFNNVYSNYNELQKSAGYDLSIYSGKTATLYRYNIPELNGSTNAYVNLIIYDGRVIGGDISSTELDGFMYSLKEIK